ncbi:MAG TPA: hypothetical protein VG722_00610 [Tepidisphaeraceae bacterium]|nr:hypothetical protein [Tepidisphaeraceae bacterium]
MIRKHKFRAAAISFLACVGAFLLFQSSGCYSSAARFSAAGLPKRTIADSTKVHTIPALKVSLPTPPKAWSHMPLKQTAMYSQEEWYGPSTHTGLGVVYVHVPVPMPAGTLVWLAKKEYTSRPDGGKMTRQWTDSAGRNWFEAVSKTYHAKGYVIADGANAWIAYCGYKTNFAKQPTEVALAEHAMNALRPVTTAAH